MDSEKIHALFEKHNDEYIKFENIPENERLHPRRDICAMLKMHQLNPSNENIISCAEHDEIYFSFDSCEALTENDILYLTRCGISYSSEHNSLWKFT